MSDNTEETPKQLLARLRARRDAIRAGIRNPRPVSTPFAYSFSRKSKKGKGKV